MKFFYTEYFKKRVKKRLSKYPLLQAKLVKQFKLLELNINHPSLKVHKLKGQRDQEYAILIEGDVRVTFVKVDEGLLFTDIISHEEY